MLFHPPLSLSPIVYLPPLSLSLSLSHRLSPSSLSLSLSLFNPLTLKKILGWRPSYFQICVVRVQAGLGRIFRSVWVWSLFRWLGRNQVRWLEVRFRWFIGWWTRRCVGFGKRKREVGNEIDSEKRRWRRTHRNPPMVVIIGSSASWMRTLSNFAGDSSGAQYNLNGNCFLQIFKFEHKNP